MFALSLSHNTENMGCLNKTQSIFKKKKERTKRPTAPGHTENFRDRTKKKKKKEFFFGTKKKGQGGS